MDFGNYLSVFQVTADQLDQQRFSKEQLEVRVGIWRSSVCLKIQKPAWVNKSATAGHFRESVFFSVWINDETINKGKLYYNTHALKMRELNGYTIKSRDFAAAFRLKFKPYETLWPNVSTAFGPLTLMEGWVEIDSDKLITQVAGLANQFLSVAPIIDELLAERRK